MTEITYTVSRAAAIAATEHEFAEPALAVAASGPPGYISKATDPPDGPCLAEP